MIKRKSQETRLNLLNDKIQQCRQCSLCDLQWNIKDITKGYGKLYGWRGGTKKCRFFFIGMNPSYRRFENIEYAFGGRGFKKGTGVEFVGFLEKLGIVEESYITNLVKCLVNPKTPIYTQKGWKCIRDIKVGEKVLTHRGRFRKVKKVFNEPFKDNKIVRITFISNEYDRIETDTLTVTREHPILTNTGWKKASELNKNDKIKNLATRCSECNKLIIKKNFDIDKKRFCSRKCRNRNYLEERHKTDEKFRYKITKKANETVKQLVKDGKWKHFGNVENHWMKKLSAVELKRWRKFWKKQGEKNFKEMKKRDINLDEIGKKALKKYYQTHDRVFMTRNKKIIPAKNTKIELIMKNVLKNENIQFRDDLKIGWYHPDIVLNEAPIIIECNGTYWHKSKEQELKSRRTKYLESKGYKVIIFDENEILKEVSSCISEVKRVLSNDLHKYEFIETNILKIENIVTKRKFRRYNLEVEDDESFIAKGVIVHNCSTKDNKINETHIEPCLSHLTKEFEILQPEKIIAMGKDPHQAMVMSLEKDSVLATKLHTIWHPNYVMSYNRHLIDEYLDRIKKICH